MTATHVTVRNLTKRFGDFTAVNQVSLDVNAGEIFGFLGPNGAGKSTTIRMLCGLLQPTSGEAKVLGYSALTEREAIRQSIGYMSQKFSLYDDLTPRENLEFFGSLYGLRGHALSAKVRRSIDEADIGDNAKRLTRELPAGIKQRLALGSATMHDPQILFLDEPTSGVDPLTRQNFWRMIYSFAAQKKTVFVTTHYMDEAEHCGRIALIIAGKIIALDSPAALKKALPFDVYAIEADDFVGAYSHLSSLDFVQDAALFGRSIHLHIDTSAKNRARLMKEVKKISGTISLIDASLEDVFVLNARRNSG
jgi:ABC-2 type transport system ATP-binding protein